MAANKNLLKPASGDPIVSSKLLDITLGCYWMTKNVDGELGEGKFFATPNQAITAYEFGMVSLRAKVKVLGSDKAKYGLYQDAPFETSVGRLLFNSMSSRRLPVCE
jgi:DNA-directed RNA polymerase subunit beta'